MKTCVIFGMIWCNLSSLVPFNFLDLLKRHKLIQRHFRLHLPLIMENDKVWVIPHLYRFQALSGPILCFHFQPSNCRLCFKKVIRHWLLIWLPDSLRNISYRQALRIFLAQNLAVYRLWRGLQRGLLDLRTLPCDRRSICTGPFLWKWSPFLAIFFTIWWIQCSFLQFLNMLLGMLCDNNVPFSLQNIVVFILLLFLAPGNKLLRLLSLRLHLLLNLQI